MYVYWWHVRGLRAVKVGHAEEPRQRVSDYRHEYGLGGKDVRVCKLDGDTDAEWVESQLCRLLEARGFHRIAVRLEEGEEELFALGGRTFEDVHGLLHEAARHIALAEVSNRRKQQRRQALQAVEEPIPREPEPEEELEEEADHEHEEPQSPQHRPSAPSRAPSAALLWLFLIGATVLLGVAASVDDSVLAPKNLAEEKESAVTATAPDTGSPAGPRRNGNCRLVELSDTLIQVNCTGSSASMRWNGRWVLDSGHDERDALDFFNASDAARRVAAPLSREPVLRLPDQAEVEPERLPPSHKPVTPPAPPLQPQQAAPRPATMPPQPQPQPQPQPAAPRPAAAPQAQPQQRPQEPPQPRQHCSVSRPKPGFQVYLVTCPNSQATIGRTVDVTTGWTVSESVNGTEAIEFFLKSPYAR